MMLTEVIAPNSTGPSATIVLTRLWILLVHMHNTQYTYAITAIKPTMFERTLEIGKSILQVFASLDPASKNDYTVWYAEKRA